jgi:hypothetical protein
MPDYLSPRERFQANKDAVEKHRSLVSHPSFEKSLEVALAQYQHQESFKADRNLEIAAATQFKISGAHQFVQLLRNLSEQEPTPKPQTFPQLHPT